MNTITPTQSQPITDSNGVMTPAFQQFITRSANNITLVGTGTPEGVLEAAQYSEYIDETTPTAPVIYRKMLPSIGGDRKKGWVAI